jgi:hypothetical protein
MIHHVLTSRAAMTQELLVLDWAFHTHEPDWDAAYGWRARPSETGRLAPGTMSKGWDDYRGEPGP